MGLTRTAARDELLALVKTALDSAGVVSVAWPDVSGNAVTEASAENTEWARVSLTHTGGSQGTFGEAGGRTFERTGLLAVQVFTPAGDGLERSDSVCQALLDAFDGGETPGGAKLRRARATEVGHSGPWNQANVVADFEYDETK
jgi:hypothetical protein